MTEKIHTDVKSIDSYYEELESLARPEQGVGIITKSTRIKLDEREIYFGVSFSGRWQILLPTEQIRRLPELGLESLEFEAHTLDVNDSMERFMILTCLDRTVNGAFSYLISEILNRIVEGFEGSPAILVRTVVADWRKLLRAKTQAMTMREATGLAGEISILEKLVLLDPVAALESWQGSERALHDFRGPQIALEVKSWRTSNAEVLFFESYEQLQDPTDHSVLFLASVEVIPNPKAESLSERVRRLAQAGVPQHALRIAMAKRGLVEFGTSNDDFRFETGVIKIWPVDSNFPRVVRNELNANMALRLKEMSFSLDLGGLENELDEDQSDDVLRRMLGI